MTSSWTKRGLFMLLLFCITSCLAVMIDYSKAWAEIPASQGKSIFASTVAGATYGAGFAVDGSIHTVWKASGANLPQYLKVDLGQSYTVRRIETVFENSQSYYQYRLEGSLDGINWTMFADKMSHTQINFPKYSDSGSMSARYVRLTVTGVGTPGDIASVAELQVFAASTTGLTLLSQGKMADASTFFGSGWEAAKAVDGSLATKWAPRTNDLPQWLIIDLGKQAGISQIETTYDNRDEIYKYRIDFSIDGNVWYPFADRTGNMERNNPKYIDNGNVTARYVRIVTTGMGTADRYFSIAELQVYGSAEDVSGPNGGGSCTTNCNGGGTCTTNCGGGGTCTTNCGGGGTCTTNCGGGSTCTSNCGCTSNCNGSQATVTDIEMDSSTYLIIAGNIRAVQLTATYSDDSSRTISGSKAAFTIEDSGIASITSSGLLTGLMAGTTSIQASYEGRTTTAIIQVTSAVQATLNSLTLDTTSLTMNSGDEQALTVIANYSDGSSADVTTASTYTSSNRNIVSIGLGGILKGGDSGNATITVRYKGQTTTMSVNINRVLDRLAFNANTFYVEPGNSASFILTAYYSDGKSAIITTEATYASSDPSIASIGAGTISGTKNGEATITAYYDGENGYANIVIGTGAGIGAAAISDNQAPIWSPEAVVRTSNITANGMTLSWDAAYDNTGVQSYIIYQNDSELTSLSGSSRSYTVSGLSGGQSYTFRIEAADSAGNRSVGPSVTSQPSGSPAIHPVTEAAQTPIRTAYSEEDEGGAEARSSIRIAAATEWRSTDSGETLVAMVSQDDLEQALSNESKSRVIVQVDDDEAQRAVLELPVHSLLAAAADKRVVFKLSGSTLELPVSAASQIAADSGDGLLRLIISKGSKEQASAAAKLAGKEKVKILLPAPVEFAIEVNGHIVSDYNGAYMERKIALTGANAAVQEAAAMWLDTSTGMWGAVPTVVSGSDSRKEVTIKAPYSGIFTIIQVNRAFKDTASHAAKQEIAYLASRAILSGEAEGVFSPNKAVSRAEFSALLVRSLGLEKLAEASTDTGFKDVVTDDWFAATASVAVKYGLIEGFEDGTFKPEEQITKEQMAVMLYRAAQLAGAKPESADSSRVLNGLADKDQVKSWSKAAFEYLFSQGVVTKTKDNKLIPQAIATRADAAVMLRRLLQTLNM